MGRHSSSAIPPRLPNSVSLRHSVSRPALALSFRLVTVVSEPFATDRKLASLRGTTPDLQELL